MAPHVLIFDNPNHDLHRLAVELNQAGYSVQHRMLASLSDTAMDADVVVLNINSSLALPWCEALRETPTGALLPVIFVGRGQPHIQTPADALSFGGDTFVHDIHNIEHWRSVLAGFGVTLQPQALPTVNPVRLNPAVVNHDMPHGALGKQEILAKHHMIMQGHYFEILDVDHGASQDALNHQYEHLLARFDPQQCPSWLLTEHRGRLMDICAVIEDAYRVLSDPILRARYLHHLTG